MLLAATFASIRQSKSISRGLNVGEFLMNSKTSFVMKGFEEPSSVFHCFVRSSEILRDSLLIHFTADACQFVVRTNCEGSSALVVIITKRAPSGDTSNELTSHGAAGIGG